MARSEFAAAVERADARIQGGIVRTPLEFSPILSREMQATVLIKWECDQRTGSFKLRGALNAVLSLAEAVRRSGIISASTGNHGLAMTRAARLVGAPLTLYVPRTTSTAKQVRLRQVGADLVIDGDSCEAAEALARQAAVAWGKTYVSPYNDSAVIAGQGTVGLEILAAARDADAVLVPVGGGGLAAGIAGYIKGKAAGIKVWGVEPRHSAFMRASLAAGRLVEIKEKPTLADAVAGGIEPGSITFPLCRRYLRGIISVSERMLAEALTTLTRIHGRSVEGAGALALAALGTEKRRFRGQTVVLVVSGRNAA